MAYIWTDKNIAKFTAKVRKVKIIEPLESARKSKK